MRLERSLNWHLAWPDEKGPFATGMIERINKALQKPIKDLNAGDLRQLVSQKIALEYTVPLAIDAIGRNPMQYSSYDEGDLLLACLKIELSFWAKNPDQHARLKSFFDTVRVFDSELQAQVKTFFALEFASTNDAAVNKAKKRKPK